MSDRNEVLKEAYTDWLKKVDSGVDTATAREQIFNDYELLDIEMERLKAQMLPVVELKLMEVM